METRIIGELFENRLEFIGADGNDPDVDVRMLLSL